MTDQLDGAHAPLLERFHADCLPSEGNRAEVRKILDAGQAFLRYNRDYQARCEQELATAIALNNGTYPAVTMALSQFFEAQSNEMIPSFDEVRQTLYERSFYPIAEHLIFAFPYGQKRASVELGCCDTVLGSRERTLRVLDVGVGPGIIACMLCDRFLRLCLVPHGALVLTMPVALPMAMHVAIFRSIDEVWRLAEQSGYSIVEGYLYPFYGGSLDVTILLERK
jgi:hypothetical protein